jgi:hypothetical protein
MTTRTLLLLLCIALFGVNARAQTGSAGDSSLSTPSNDSLLQAIRDLVKDLDVRKSMFSASIGVGNRLYSMRNDGMNAQQATQDQYALTPMVSYVHKTGLGLTGMAYGKLGDGNLTPYQFVLSPSYDRIGRGKLAYGVSYAHYFVRDDLDFYATPLTNELYAYIHTRKTWLEPGLSVGWAGGSFREVRSRDTTLLGIPRHITDTIRVHLQDFTVAASLSHDFNFDDVFVKGDGISFEPRISLVAGTTAYTYDLKRTVLVYRKLLTRTRIRTGSKTGNSGLQMQSAGFSLTGSYIIGKWAISPQYYLGYYFQDSEKPFTQLFSLSVMVMF